jgi:hypothetical protein
MYQINRAPSFQIPGLDRFIPIKHDYSGIERGLSALGKGLATSLEERKLQEALDKANNPEVEKLQRAQQATQEELERARMETASVLEQEARQAVYGSANPTTRTPEQEQEVQDWLSFANTPAPAEKAAGLERTQWVDPNAQTQQDYYRVGNQEFRDAPDPQSLGIITSREKAKVWEARDPRLAMQYEADAQRQLAQQMEQRYLQLEQTRDVPGAVRLYSDIPDGITAVEKQLADGTWQVFTHPDGRPEEAQPFAQGNGNDIFGAIRRTLDPKAWDSAAKLKYERDRQAATDQRLAQQESRYAANDTRQQLTTQVNYLQKLKEAAIAQGNQADFIRYGMLEEQTLAQLLSMGQGGPGGTGQGESPGWLVQNESGGRWDAQNDAMGAGGSPGHFGRMQFGVARLREAQQALGRSFTPDEFMADPQLQMAVETWHKNDIGQYIQEQGWDTSGGVRVLGTPMTPGAMFAVAHLGGKGGLSKFIETGGVYNPSDVNGTRLSDYAARGHQGDIQQSPVIQSGVLRNQYGGPQAAQQAPGGPAVSPGLAPADMRPAAPTPQDRSIGALGTDFGQAWAARTAAVPAKLTDREKIRHESYYKERLEIKKSGASPDVQQRMLENLATDYPDVVGGGGAPGQAPGLSPEGTALFGLEDQGAAPAAGGTAGAAESKPPGADEPAKPPTSLFEVLQYEKNRAEAEQADRLKAAQGQSTRSQKRDLAKSKEYQAAIEAADQALRPGGTAVERAQALNGLAKIYESMPPLKQKEAQELARRLQGPIPKLRSTARGQRGSAQAPEYDP